MGIYLPFESKLREVRTQTAWLVRNPIPSPSPAIPIPIGEGEGTALTINGVFLVAQGLPTKTASRSAVGGWRRIPMRKARRKRRLREGSAFTREAPLVLTATIVHARRVAAPMRSGRE